MSTELNLLKKISENKGKAPIQLITKQLKIGNDYARYLCRDLLKKGLVKKFKKKDWYSITLKGEKETGKREKPVRKPLKRSISRKKEVERKIQKKVSKKLKKKTKKKSKKKITKRAIKKVKIKAKRKAKKIISIKEIEPRETIPSAIPSEEKFKKIIKTVLRVFKNLFFKKN